MTVCGGGATGVVVVGLGVFTTFAIVSGYGLNKVGLERRGFSADRIRKLEQRKVIQGYTTRIDAAAVGLGLTAFILVRTEERVGPGAIGQALARIPEVQELHHVAGEDCYLVKVRVADTEGLSRLLRERFGRLKGVRNTRSTIVLSTVKETAALPLPESAGAAHDA